MSFVGIISEQESLKCFGEFRQWDYRPIQIGFSCRLFRLPNFDNLLLLPLYWEVEKSPLIPLKMNVSNTMIFRGQFLVCRRLLRYIQAFYGDWVAILYNGSRSILLLVLIITAEPVRALCWVVWLFQLSKIFILFIFRNWIISPIWLLNQLSAVINWFVISVLLLLVSSSSIPPVTLCV